MKHLQLSDRQLAIEPVFADQLVREHVVAIFLHEALGSIGQWKSFPQLLCTALGVNGLVYEREGYGQSSPLSHSRAADYLHRYALEELPQLIQTLLPPEKKVLLVGHSDGASIALLYASAYPDRVAGVISMAAHVIVEEVTLAGIEPAVEAYRAGKLAGLQKYHGDKTDTLFYAWADTWRMPAFRDWNICAALETVAAPVIAIQGANDQYGTDWQLDLIEHHCAGSVQKELLSGCGHHPHLEKTQEVIHLIQNWYL